MKKNELLASIARERARLDELIAGIDDARKTEPVLDGGRSVKDVLAHISLWERACTRWLEAAARGETPDRPEVRDVDATNARGFEAARGMPLADVLATSRTAHAALLAAAAALPDAELAGDARFGWPAWQMISSNSDEHYREHAEQIRRVLGGGGAAGERAARERMEMDAAAFAFLESQRSAAMTTLRADGAPHTVRVGIAVVDGKIWSSGTEGRLRTRHVRRDPRASLMVFDAAWAYLGLDCRVRILEGADIPELSARLFEQMQRDASPAPAPGTILWYGRPTPRDEFLRMMVAEQRLIYEFEVLHSYGVYQAAAQR